ncbi:hypothetical protein CRE_14359 [Caenorhabditis remanei]|uniref:Integrase catalytic domain-containing protein n=1 Tax=Caenorhabditis remanei TaxID=31234 RepID=E3NK95_CAERE|nr:hypothetical protein CRE_14359 [Caenorhabditis remanei]
MTKKNKQAKRAPIEMKTIKGNITREFTKARTLVALIERALTFDRNEANITVLDGYTNKLSDQLMLLQNLPDYAEELLMNNKKLCAQNVIEANRAEIKTHIEFRGLDSLINQVLALEGEVKLAINLFRNNATPPVTSANSSPAPRVVSTSSTSSTESNGHSAQIANTGHSVQKTGKKAEPTSGKAAKVPSNSTESESSELSPVAASSNVLGHGSSMSSQQLMEFAEIVTSRFNGLENSQRILLESNNSMQRKMNTMEAKMDMDQRAKGANNHNPPNMPKNNNPTPILTFFDYHTGRPVFETEPIHGSHQERVEFPRSKHNHIPENINNSCYQEKPSPPRSADTMQTVTNTVPTFSGNPEEYAVFKQLFDLFVHEDDAIPVTMKHALLLNLLTGEAKTMMRSTKISEADYYLLRDNLERQFNRESENKQYYIDKIDKFSFSEEDFKEIEKEMNEYRILVNALRNKGCAVDDQIFINNFIKKLPECIMATVFKKNHEYNRTFDELVGIAYRTLAEKRALQEAREKKKQMVRTSEVYALNTADSSKNTRKGKFGNKHFRYKFCRYCFSNEHSAIHCNLSLSQKLKIVENKKLCTNCLLANHKVEQCKSQNSCFKCQERHHTAHCTKVGGEQKNVDKKEKPNLEIRDIGPENDKEPLLIYVSRNIAEDNKLPYMTLKTPRGTTLLALVDCGASTSILSTQTAVNLNLQMTNQRNIAFAGFISESSPDKSSYYDLEVVDLNGKHWIANMPSYDKMNIRFTSPKLTSQEVEDLKNLEIDMAPIRKLSKYNGMPIDLLLGNNVLGNINQELTTLSSGRMVTRTILGPIIFPPKDKNALVPSQNIYSILVIDDSEHIDVFMVDTQNHDMPQQKRVNISNQQLAKQVEQHWNLELLGMEPPEIVSSKARINEELIAKYKNTSIRDESKLLQVLLPFNGREHLLSNNLPVATRRLVILTKGQRRERRLNYHAIIQLQLESGIIELVTPDMVPDGPVYYFPHRDVIKEDSNNTKTRIVLDASSHEKGKLSLNDCLHPGPSILQKIMGILIRSRLSKYLMISDIEKAFHQVRLQKQCRDVTRFLWLEDPELDATPDNIVTYRFTRLPFGVTSSPFLLAMTILQYLEFDPDPINARIIENLYVDNVLLTTNDPVELASLYTKLKEVFQKMHMNLREFLCNNSEVMKLIKSEDQAPKMTNKLLGHLWDSEKDNITIKIATPPAGTPTKREVVAFLAMNYDPTGLISPIVVPVKKFITLLWNPDLKWGDRIPDILMPMWTAITKVFTVNTYTIPRQLVTTYDYTHVDLVVFSDASQDHYAAAAYLRYDYQGKHYQSQLIFSKSRIKPGRNGITIPQLELLALQTGTNVALNLIEELHIPIRKVTFFSDSTCVLHWVLQKIGNHIGLKWAANRVTETRNNLKKLSELNLHPELRYVPTNINPADIATRGCSVTELQNNELWHKGPAFLQRKVEDWPQTLETTPNDPQQFHVFVMRDREKVLSREHHVQPEPSIPESDILVNVLESDKNEVHSIVPYSRTNNMRKLITISNYVLSFIHSCIKKRNNRFPGRSYKYRSSTMQQYEQADKDEDEIEKRKITRTFIISDHYRDAKERFRLDPPAKFNPVLSEEGLYRHTRPFVNSRHHRHSDEMKEPIIIIHKHPLASLLIMESHISLLHQGIKDVISDIQKKYWIEKIGTLVRKMRRECVTCQKMHARPFAYPYATALPQIRSQLVAPFAFVGLDYFGPLRYKTKEDNGKIWVLLVTCLVTRAVHLEIVQDNTTHSFILALKRYFGRRGVPQSILSDNAPAFKLGYNIMNKDIKSLINTSLTLTSFLADKEIDIRLITPFSPWKGGIYERLVALVKNMLHKVLGKITIPFLELESLIIESEGILNSRPITANKIHVADAKPIRPVDYLIPNAALALPEKSGTIFGLIKSGETEMLTRRLLESTAAVRENLWNVFSDEYYALLRESAARPTAHSRDSPKPGTTVFVVTDKVARYRWPIGVIQKLIPSKDGKIRSVEVKIGKRILEKSVNHLIPLELPPEDQKSPASEAAPQDTIPNVDSKRDEPTANPTPPQASEVQSGRTRPYLHRKAKGNNTTDGRNNALKSSSADSTTSD